jgi:hypothetical protein
MASLVLIWVVRYFRKLIYTTPEEVEHILLTYGVPSTALYIFVCSVFYSYTKKLLMETKLDEALYENSTELLNLYIDKTLWDITTLIDIMKYQNVVSSGVKPDSPDSVAIISKMKNYLDSNNYSYGIDAETLLIINIKNRDMENMYKIYGLDDIKNKAILDVRDSIVKMLTARNSANYTKSDTSVPFPVTDLIVQGFLVFLCILIIFLIVSFKPTNMLRSRKFLKECMSSTNLSSEQRIKCDNVASVVTNQTKTAIDPKLLVSLSVFITCIVLTAKVYSGTMSTDYDFTES